MRFVSCDSGTGVLFQDKADIDDAIKVLEEARDTKKFPNGVMFFVDRQMEDADEGRIERFQKMIAGLIRDDGPIVGKGRIAPLSIEKVESRGEPPLAEPKRKS